jgi:hypothetical protein
MPVIAGFEKAHRDFCTDEPVQSVETSMCALHLASIAQLLIAAQH